MSLDLHSNPFQCDRLLVLVMLVANICHVTCRIIPKYMEKYGISPITKWYVISELWFDVVIFHLDCHQKIASLNPCYGFSQVELPFFGRTLSFWSVWCMYRTPLDIRPQTRLRDRKFWHRHRLGSLKVAWDSKIREASICCTLGWFCSEFDDLISSSGFQTNWMGIRVLWIFPLSCISPTAARLRVLLVDVTYMIVTFAPKLRPWPSE